MQDVCIVLTVAGFAAPTRPFALLASPIACAGKDYEKRSPRKMDVVSVLQMTSKHTARSGVIVCRFIFPLLPTNLNHYVRPAPVFPTSKSHRIPCGKSNRETDVCHETTWSAV
jgi:hypothetical protein